MTLLALEDFEDPGEPRGTGPEGPVLDPETLRSTAFEKGYQAGWDDAVRAEDEAQEHLDAELGRNLEEMSFSFFEAQRQVCLSLEPLLRTMAEKVLPEFYHDLFASVVEDMITPLIKDCANLNAEVLCATQDLEQVTQVLSKHNALPLTVRAEPSFTRYQVNIKLGHEVHEINGDALLSQLRGEIDRYFSETKQASSNAS